MIGKTNRGAVSESSKEVGSARVVGLNLADTSGLIEQAEVVV